MSSSDRNEAVLLAAERGYRDPVLRNGHLVVHRNGVAIDWATEILYPMGLAPYGALCSDWREACRLLGMVPPTRG